MSLLPPLPPIPHFPANREFSFTAQDFARVKQIIYRHAGIVLNDSKFDMVYGRLVRRLRAKGLNSFEVYLQLLEKDSVEFESFVNALTTNLTSFFRESHHFPILSDFLKKQKASGQQLTIWCAAASTGEEPYSLAMTVFDVYESFSAPVKIIASDIDTQVLRMAEQGIYEAEKVEKLTQVQRQRFFLPLPDGRYQAKPELRKLITFRRINLIEDDWPLRPGLDVIFCRNVMIYFDRDTQYGILKKFHPLLREGGLLFVGHSENFFFAADIFTLQGKTVYSPVLTRRRIKD
jgi:chemotaxis protein methyltransferase CheR